MPGWPEVRLDECCDIVSGATPSTAVPEYWGGDICWVTPKDLSELEGAVIADTPRKITEAGLASCAAEVLPAGSVLFSSRAPIGHVAINAAPMATNQGFKSFVPKQDRIESRFLYWWLKAHRPYMESLGNGATFKEVSKAVVSRVQIPLPPLCEQRRIAEVLERAEALRAKRRAALRTLESLQQAVFLDLFGDPTTNPKGWRTQSLGEVVDLFAGNSLPPGVPFTGQGGGFFLAKVSDMNTPGNEEALVVCREWSSSPGARSATCPAGAVVIPKRGGAIGTNKKRLTTRPTVLDPNLMGVSARVSSVLPEYLYQWFLHLNLKSLVSGSSVPQLNKQDLVPLPLAVPPLDLQRKFAAFVLALRVRRQRIEVSLGVIEELFASLQHRAFRGEL